MNVSKCMLGAPKWENELGEKEEGGGGGVEGR